MDRITQEGYGDDEDRYIRRREVDVASFKKESKPWRGSSGFGIANILNRNTSSIPRSTMPAISLPSFHSFGKPLIAKPERHMALYNNYEEENQQISIRQQHQHGSADSSPARQSSPTLRHIVVAPADEDEADQEMDSTAADTHGGIATQSIRGGRWTVDEHERFLEGFRIHGHKWKRVQHVVRTRSVTQVRTHAQKYLLKVAKLKAEKKQCGKSVDMTTLSAERSSKPTTVESIDGGTTESSSTPEQGGSNDSPRKCIRKKVRRLDHGSCDPVDQEYIAAAATTLCFLMSQKIDSLIDTRHELQVETSKDYEPYDCYAPQPAELNAEHGGSRKRSYTHYLTDQQDDFGSSLDTGHGEPSSYTFEGKKLCS
ncbi:unnamed protein product [Peronospora belbahrii]|uniref:HTH myb-type domain-containing protein n=1 Tax=Peronospora belbahrii TaxID=622444 RepID=A0ABN8CXJ4_9STRA|nr:unnamed protein product [Peronospora belbahrii]